jgi:hypothetical protein
MIQWGPAYTEGGWALLQGIGFARDAIRTDPRFRAVSGKLKAADIAARARFRARPDLNDAAIESLGTWQVTDSTVVPQAHE